MKRTTYPINRLQRIAMLCLLAIITCSTGCGQNRSYTPGTAEFRQALVGTWKLKKVRMGGKEYDAAQFADTAEAAARKVAEDQAASVKRSPALGEDPEVKSILAFPSHVRGSVDSPLSIRDDGTFAFAGIQGEWKLGAHNSLAESYLKLRESGDSTLLWKGGEIRKLSDGELHVEGSRRQPKIEGYFIYVRD